MLTASLCAIAAALAVDDEQSELLAEAVAAARELLK